jgi:hypothetical protein
MPVRKCTEDGKPGYSCGDLKCYTYTSGNEQSRKTAKRKAIAQCIAIGEPPGSEATLGKEELRETIEIESRIIAELLKKGCGCDDA